MLPTSCALALLILFDSLAKRFRETSKWRLGSVRNERASIERRMLLLFRAVFSRYSWSSLRPDRDTFSENCKFLIVRWDFSIRPINPSTTRFSMLLTNRIQENTPLTATYLTESFNRFHSLHPLIALLSASRASLLSLGNALQPPNRSRTNTVMPTTLTPPRNIPTRSFLSMTSFCFFQVLFWTLNSPPRCQETVAEMSPPISLRVIIGSGPKLALLLIKSKSSTGNKSDELIGHEFRGVPAQILPEDQSYHYDCTRIPRSVLNFLNTFNKST